MVERDGHRVILERGAITEAKFQTQSNNEPRFLGRPISEQRGFLASPRARSRFACLTNDFAGRFDHSVLCAILSFHICGRSADFSLCVSNGTLETECRAGKQAETGHESQGQFLDSWSVAGLSRIVGACDSFVSEGPIASQQ
jgi:hypothetical protein